jgi:hypothetical protein
MFTVETLPMFRTCIRCRNFLLVAAVAGSVGEMRLHGQEVQIRLRDRTDKNVQSDIDAAMEWQRKLLGANATAGLSELAASSASIRSQETSGQQPFDGATSSSGIVIGSSSGAVPSKSQAPSPAAPLPEAESPDSSGTRARGGAGSSVVGSSFDEEAQRRPSIESGVHIEYASPMVGPTLKQVSPANPNAPVAYRVQILPPPRISSIDGWTFEKGLVGANNASTKQLYRPVSAMNAAADPEASIAPSFNPPGGSVFVGDSGVSQAAYQLPGGFATPPAMAAPPSGFSNPGLAAPVMPGPSTSTVVPNSSTLVPGSMVPNSSMPLPMRTYPTNPPVYGPSSASSIMSGEPFVTGPPCQFDAAYMVEPASYSASSCSPSCGGGSGFATGAPPYAGIPGNIAPPTYMPNQVPAGLYGNTGWRPLFGLGQDNFNVQLGRGIIGQPVAYVVGQPFRNFLRYVFP